MIYCVYVELLSPAASLYEPYAFTGECLVHYSTKESHVLRPSVSRIFQIIENLVVMVLISLCNNPTQFFSFIEGDILLYRPGKSGMDAYTFFRQGHPEDSYLPRLYVSKMFLNNTGWD